MDGNVYARIIDGFADEEVGECQNHGQTLNVSNGSVAYLPKGDPNHLAEQDHAHHGLEVVLLLQHYALFFSISLPFVPSPLLHQLLS